MNETNNKAKANIPGRRKKNPGLIADINSGSLKFKYHKTNVSFQALFNGEKWTEGEWDEEDEIKLHQGSTALHYAQQCFEGLKAYESPEREIVLFRPWENWARMKKTAGRLMLTCPEKELFLGAVREISVKNWEFIPPFGSRGSLYIRPFLMGCGEHLGLTPADRVLFRVFVSPVGDYFSGKCAKLKITNQNRCAPNGIGQFKAGANYASGFLTSHNVRQGDRSVHEVLYLDPKESRFLDEAGSANVIVLFKDGTLATPESSSILESITRRSVLEIAQSEGRPIEHRPIEVGELENAAEVAMVGTAATLTPVGEIVAEDRSFRFLKDGETSGPIMAALRDKLFRIQTGEAEDPFGWTEKIKVV